MPHHCGRPMNKRIGGLGLGVLLVNSGYLAAFAEPSIFYMGNVLLHLGLGLGLMVLAALWARRYPWECGAFLLSGLPALYLVVGGNTLDHRWALWLHILLAAIAVATIGRRLFRAASPRAWRMAFVAAVAAGVLLPAGSTLYRRARPDRNGRIRNPLVAPVSMDQEGAGEPPPFAQIGRAT